MCRTIIHNGNRTESSPIRSVIIRMINKIGRPHSGGFDLFNDKYDYRPTWTTRSPVTNNIIINHNHYNFRENKCIPFFVKELLMPSIEKKFIHFGKSSVW